MPGLFGLLELGRRSLSAYQSAIATAGHNVANANTPGFHRQRVNLNATAVTAGALGIGSGVRVSSIGRIQSRFLDLALQNEMPALSRFSARSEVLSQTESVFNEPSGSGVTSVLDGFFDAWDDLASNPEDPGARESVVRLGVSLADVVRTARRRLVDQQTIINSEIGRVVDDTNLVLAELQRTNQNILQSSSQDGIPGDLEDRRDLLTEKLGGLVGTSVSVNSDGTATVRMAGRVILQASSLEKFELDLAKSDVPNLVGQRLRSEELDGRIGGLLDVRDQDLGEMIRRLDEFAVRIASDVNSIHGQGIDANGDAAGPFFVFSNLDKDGVGNAAFGLQVAAKTIEDSSLVAAGANDASGDNTVALDIAAMRHDVNGPAAVLRQLVVSAGARALEAHETALGQQLLVNSFEAQRESISGVSLDEEAADLMRYQRSYQAAARIMSIADEMAQTILAL